MKILVAILCLALLGCTSRKDTLLFNLSGEAVQLDWNKANDVSSGLVLDNIMEGLTSYAATLQANQQGDLMRPVPALASSWTIEQDGTLYRFHIRENVRWSDGQQLVAQQFVDSWQRLLDPATKSTSSYQLFDIAGAQEYASGQLKDFSKVGIKAVGNFVLEVTLKRSVSYFLHLLATPATFPIRKDLLDKYGVEWTDTQNLVTLGPYLLKDMRLGEKINLEANRYYWEGTPAIRYITIKMVTEPVTALALYQRGNLDIIPQDLPVSSYDFWATHDDFKTGAKLSVSYLVFNTRKGPFSDVKNRKKFAEVVDRDLLAKVFKGAQTPTTTLIPPGMFGHMPGIGINPNPKSSLSSFPPIRLAFQTNDNLSLAFQNLQNSLQKIGLEQLRLEPLEAKDFRTLMVDLGRNQPKTALSEQPNLYFVSWSADYPDPHNFMNIFVSNSENNQSGWQNRKFDQLVVDAVETEIESRRMSLYEQAQRILLEEDCVILPLFFSSHQALVRANIKGVVINSLDKWYFKNFRFED